MNPKSQRDRTFSAGPMLAYAQFDYSALYSGFNYSSQSGWMVFKGIC